MPSVTTPFAVTVAAGDEVTLAATPRVGGGGGDAFGGNDFAASISSVVFAEEHSAALQTTMTARADDSADGVAAVAHAAARRVRVSLLAVLTSHDVDGSADARVRADDDTAHTAAPCVTLASYEFDANARCACASCAAANDACVATTHDDANAPPSPYLVLRSQLPMRANGVVRALRVCAHVVSPRGVAVTAPYAGPRRFVVQLIGWQVTRLSAHQMRLITDG